MSANFVINDPTQGTIARPPSQEEEDAARDPVRTLREELFILWMCAFAWRWEQVAGALTRAQALMGRCYGEDPRYECPYEEHAVLSRGA